MHNAEVRGVIESVLPLLAWLAWRLALAFLLHNHRTGDFLSYGDHDDSPPWSGWLYIA
jgi:hypothetical protein